MRAHQAEHTIESMSHVLGVSPSGYWAWCKREASKRSLGDEALVRQIRTAHEASRGTYGVPRVWRTLRDAGVEVGRDRVARLMRQAGLRGVTRRRFVVTTRRDERACPAPDLVERRTRRRGPRLWVADITYVPTRSGFLYLAVVLDAFSRKVVGRAMATHLRTALVLAALDMAIAPRRPKDVVHHSDQGCQYTSIAFSERCRATGVRPSMRSVGDAYDNAMAESFFATMECELQGRVVLDTPEHGKGVVFAWTLAWYNTQRMHSSIGYVSPVEHERRHAASAAERENGGSAPAPPGTMDGWLGGEGPERSGSSRKRMTVHEIRELHRPADRAGRSRRRHRPG